MYYRIQMSINSNGNLHVQTAFPFKIPQSQPQEGTKTYMQRNFPSTQNVWNASIDNPRIQVLTPPWRMHRPDEPCPFYAPNGEFNEIRGKVQTGYKLDYDRTNHEINVKSHIDKNKWSRVRQMQPNEFIDIRDSVDNVDIADGVINPYANPYTNNSNPYTNPYTEKVNPYSENVNPYTNNINPYNPHFFGNTETFNTPRNANRTAGSLNNTTFYSPNDNTYTKYNQPIKQTEQNGTVDSSSVFVQRDNLKDYNDTVTIRDTFNDDTDWANESTKEQYCPLKEAIHLKEKAAKDSWNKVNDTNDEPVNREAYRRSVHKRHDDVKEARDKLMRIQARAEELRKEEEERKKNIAKINRPAKPPKESFECQCQPYLDNMYTHILEARASAIIMYLIKDPSFRPWMHNWELLQRNISKCNMNFKQLSDSHEDVAYSIDKGAELSFRFRDKDKYLPLSVESYILAHEMAHVANEEIGHGEKFQELMHLIEVAAYMLQFIDVSKYPTHTVHSNGQEILSRASIKQELYEGIDNLIAHSSNPEQKEYWRQVKKRVENNK